MKPWGVKGGIETTLCAVVNDLNIVLSLWYGEVIDRSDGFRVVGYVATRANFVDLGKNIAAVGRGPQSTLWG